MCQPGGDERQMQPSPVTGAVAEDFKSSTSSGASAPGAAGQGWRGHHPWGGHSWAWALFPGPQWGGWQRAPHDFRVHWKTQSSVSREQRVSQNVQWIPICYEKKVFLMRTSPVFMLTMHFLTSAPLSLSLEGALNCPPRPVISWAQPWVQGTAKKTSLICFLPAASLAGRGQFFQVPRWFCCGWFERPLKGWIHVLYHIYDVFLVLFWEENQEKLFSFLIPFHPLSIFYSLLPARRGRTVYFF